jgi:hypothetical protein
VTINSKSKGARSEREFAAFLREYFGVNARRGVQYQGSADSPDVVSDFTDIAFEVKHVEKSYQQAVSDAACHQVPVVAHRRNHSDWLVTFKASDIKKFIEAIKKVTCSN